MPAAEVREHMLDRLDRATASARRRASVDLLFAARPRLRDEAATKLFYALASRRWAQRGHTAEHLEPFVRGLELCSDPKHILDLGTGAGATARMLAARYPGATVIGLDRSRSMLARAKDEPLPANLELRRGSVRRLALPAGAFDLVTLLNFFPELGELRRVTAAGSRVLMASSFGRLRDRSASYLRRWRTSGFERGAAADAGRGNYELFVRDGGDAH